MRIVLLIAASLTYSSAAYAQGSGLCPGLSGNARTQCLERERAKAQQQVQNANATNRRLDTGIKVVCTMRKGGDLAGAGAAVGGGSVGQQAAGAWAAGRTAGSVLTNGQDKCPGQ